MSQSLNTIPSPALLVELNRLEKNLEHLQKKCDATGTELWPHIKTHKMVEIAKRQLALGAKGLTCAKVSEALAMLPSGVRRIFVAHSIIEPTLIEPVRQLHASLDELILAATSLEQAKKLGEFLDLADLEVPVMLGINTGLHREGTRSLEEAKELAAFIRQHPRMQLKGLYGHEGFFYGVPEEERAEKIDAMLDQLEEARQILGEDLKLWPGCTITGELVAESGRADAVRPGAYVAGDLSCWERNHIMERDDCAVLILATVIDKPAPGLALINAGSKTFSGDKTPQGIVAREFSGRDITVVRVNEEHGYLEGKDVDQLALGERLRFIPAHVCTCINMHDHATVIRGDSIVEEWKVDARGCIT